MRAGGPEESDRRRAAFREWAALHGLAVDEDVRIVEGVVHGVRVRLATGITEKGHWPIIVDVRAPLDKQARLRELVGAAGIPRSVTSIVATRTGARLRLWPSARFEDIEVAIAALPRSDARTRPYR